MSTRVIRLATRTSPLARYQADVIADRIRRADPDIEVRLVGVESAGDARPDAAIRTLAGEGVFTAAVDRAVIERRAEMAVHSAKDLPSIETDDGLTLAAIPERADARDVLVGTSLSELAPGAVVATGAVRRRVQLAFIRPDIGFADLRGNIETRIAKLPSGGAVVVANAALLRLNIAVGTAEILSMTVMLPQVGQGAIALRCRKDDEGSMTLAREIDDRVAHRAVRAERAFLRRLGGGCDAPVAAHATCTDEHGPIVIDAMVASTDGHVLTKKRGVGDEPAAVGLAVAEALLQTGGASSLIDLAFTP